MISGDGSNLIDSIFAHEGGQYSDYRLTPLHSPVIINDATPKIIDTRLRLIFRTL
jgi:hypothetical protein